MSDMTKQGKLQALADYVRVTRTRKGISQTDIPKRGGPSGGWIGGLEAGLMDTVPKAATLVKLAKSLDVPLSEIEAVMGEGLHREQTVIRPSLEVIEGFRGVMAHPPTAEETAFIRAAESETVWYGPLYSPGFWNRTPDERRGHLIYLEGLTREARKLRQEDHAKQVDAQEA